MVVQLRSLKIFWKFFIAILCLLILIIIAASILFSKKEEAIIREEIHKKNVEITRNLSLNSREPILRRDYLTLYNLLKTLKDELDIAYGFIVDEKGRIIAHTDYDRLGGSIDMVNFKSVLSKNEVKVLSQNKLAVHQTPVNIKNEILGGVSLAFKESQIETAIFTRKKEAIREIIFIAFISLVIGAFGSFLLAYLITNPVKKLAWVSKKVGEGDLDQKIDVDSQDELGQLGKSFNFMIDRLKERQRIQELNEKLNIELMRAEKMSSVGQLTAGVAHELNNPLGSMLMYIKLALEEVPAASPLGRNLKRVEENIVRSQSIIKDLLDYSRQAEIEKIPLDIKDLMDKILIHFKKVFEEKKIKCSRNIAGDVPLIEGDEKLLSQVFSNIIQNSIDAMPKGGELEIKADVKECSLSSFGGSKTCFSGDNLKKKMVKIDFMDNGIGFSEEDISKLVDPFYTTKKNGSGLGLSICYGVVKSHGGLIKVKKRKNGGAMFTIILPLKLIENCWDLINCSMEQRQNCEFFRYKNLGVW